MSFFLMQSDIPTVLTSIGFIWDELPQFRLFPDAISFNSRPPIKSNAVTWLKLREDVALVKA